MHFNFVIVDELLMLNKIYSWTFIVGQLMTIKIKENGEDYSYIIMHSFIPTNITT